MAVMVLLVCVLHTSLSLLWIPCIGVLRWWAGCLMSSCLSEVNSLGLSSFEDFPGRVPGVLVLFVLGFPVSISVVLVFVFVLIIYVVLRGGEGFLPWVGGYTCFLSCTLLLTAPLFADTLLDSCG